MKLVNAELSDYDGEEAVMRAVREYSVYELAGSASLVVPLAEIEGFTKEKRVYGDIWVPISCGEDPVHISIDSRYDLHNLLPDQEKPPLEPVDVAPTEQDERWHENYRRVRSTTYQFAGTIAAQDIRVNPCFNPLLFDKKDYKRRNKLFEEFIGEWGAFLLASVEYIDIEGTKQIITSARIAIIESHEELKEKQGMNPAEHFRES